MPVIVISNEQKAAATAYGIDVDNAYADGINDENGIPYSPKVDKYSDLTTENRDKAKAASSQSFAMIARHLLPISANFSNNNPNNPSITSEVEIASVSVKSFIARQVMIAFHLSAFTDAINTIAGFRVKINGTQVGPDLKYFFNTASDHRTMGGTFIGTLVSGTSTITGHLFRFSGTGVIKQDLNDNITFSVIG